MEVLHKVCAGIDVHKASVVICIRRVIGSKVAHEVRTFAELPSLLLLTVPPA